MDPFIQPQSSDFTEKHADCLCNKETSIVTLPNTRLMNVNCESIELSCSSLQSTTCTFVSGVLLLLLCCLNWRSDGHSFSLSNCVFAQVPIVPKTGCIWTWPTKQQMANCLNKIDMRVIEMQSLEFCVVLISLCHFVHFGCNPTNEQLDCKDRCDGKPRKLLSERSCSCLNFSRKSLCGCQNWGIERFLQFLWGSFDSLHWRKTNENNGFIGNWKRQKSWS